MYTNLDKIVKGYLLQRRLPIHWYIDFLIYAQRCFEEITFDTIGNVRVQRLPINELGAATLPADFMDWTKVGVQNGQFIKPLFQRNGINRLKNYENFGVIATLGIPLGGSLYTDGTYNNVPLINGSGTGATANIVVAGAQVTVCTLVNPGINYAVGDILSALNTDLGSTGSGFSIPVATITQTNQTTFPDAVGAFGNIYGWWGYTIHYNDKLEFTGRMYGAAIDRTDSFKIIPERNEIQLHQNLCATEIILEYISDGSEIDNATQVNPYAKATIEAYINWKYKENNRSYGEGERQRAQMQFDHQQRILRGRTNHITIADIKSIIYRNTLGSPK